jgi:ankyrin repeat protein
MDEAREDEMNPADSTASWIEAMLEYEGKGWVMVGSHWRWPTPDEWMAIAAERGEAEEVGRAARMGADPKAWDDGGRAMLIGAIERGHEDCALALIPLCERSMADENGWTPLMWAIGRRMRRAFAALLEWVDPKRREPGSTGLTPLMVAAGAFGDMPERDSHWFVSALLPLSDPWAAAWVPQGSHWAKLRVGRSSVGKYSLEDLNVYLVDSTPTRIGEGDPTDQFINCDALVLAVVAGHESVVALIADRAVAQDRLLLERANCYGATPLGVAAARGESKCLKELLARSRLGEVPFDPCGGALARAAGAGEASCLRMLVEARWFVPHARLADARAASFAAVESGSVECLKVLIDAGLFDGFAREPNGFTPAMRACWLGQVECAALLSALPGGGELSPKGRSGLGMALERKNWDCAKALLAAGCRAGTDDFVASIGAKDIELLDAFLGRVDPRAPRAACGRTALMEAARIGWVEGIERLAPRGGVDATDCSGRAALSFALEAGSHEAAQSLLGFGASMEVVANRPGWAFSVLGGCLRCREIAVPWIGVREAAERDASGKALVEWLAAEGNWTLARRLLPSHLAAAQEGLASYSTLMAWAMELARKGGPALDFAIGAVLACEADVKFRRAVSLKLLMSPLVVFCRRVRSGQWGSPLANLLVERFDVDGRDSYGFAPRDALEDRGEWDVKEREAALEFYDGLVLAKKERQALADAVVGSLAPSGDQLQKKRL